MSESAELRAYLERIERRHSAQIKLGLERISQVLASADLLRWSCPVITIAGTNGKGSCAKLLERIYAEAGYRTACMTSPHLDCINQRFSLTGLPVGDQVLLDTFKAVDQLKGIEALTYYEYMVVVGLWLFKVYCPDVLILEVGLGGRLDAVNALDADVALITSIGLDHCELLGYTREAIAREKMGIFRQAAIAICGEPEAPAIIGFHACTLSMAFFQLGRDFFCEQRNQRLHWHTRMVEWSDLPLAPLKPSNIGTSLMAVSTLQARLPVRKPAVVQALAGIKLPGRMECYANPCAMLFDVAHNKEACAFLVEQIKRKEKKRRLFVFAALADKPVLEMVQQLDEVAEAWYLTGLPVERALAIGDLQEIVTASSNKSCYNFANVAAAIEAAVAAVNANQADEVVVCGSFYTVAAARAFMRDQANQEILV